MKFNSPFKSILQYRAGSLALVMIVMGTTLMAGMLLVGPVSAQGDRGRRDRDRDRGDREFDVMRYLQRACLLYTSPSPRDLSTSRMPSSA